VIEFVPPGADRVEERHTVGVFVQRRWPIMTGHPGGKDKARWRVNISDDIRWEVVAPGLLDVAPLGYTYTKWLPEERPAIEALSIVYSANERWTDTTSSMRATPAIESLSCSTFRRRSCRATGTRRPSPTATAPTTCTSIRLASSSVSL
jgi:hypothetical protein